jgi:hypothetical protein
VHGEGAVPPAVEGDAGRIANGLGYPFLVVDIDAVHNDLALDHGALRDEAIDGVDVAADLTNGCGETTEDTGHILEGYSQCDRVLGGWYGWGIRGGLLGHGAET